MPDPRSQAFAQLVYLAQLQACKGSCKCSVCKLMRKAADLQTSAILNPQAAQGQDVSAIVKSLNIPGIGENLGAEEE